MDVGYEEEILEIEGRDGKRIHCVYNAVDRDEPLVVVAPPFEGTVRNNLLPMLYLVNNGFTVLRFDFVDHRGNSDGKRTEFTLSSGLLDLERVIDEVGRELPADDHGLALFGGSMSSRIAVRYLAKHHDRVQALLSLVGVVNAAATTRAATGIDYELLLRDPDHEYGCVKAINYMLNFDRWTRDLRDAGWHDTAGTRADIDRMATPTYLIVAEADDWTNIDDYQLAYAGNRGILRKTYGIPNAGHELYKTTEIMKSAMRAATRSLRGHFGLDADAPMTEPTVADLIRLNGRERNRELEHKKARC